ncbi:MAG: glycerate kinase [Alphaproteobacteria bacterium]|nr:glycerate kinase [Alphaproteobacteria bacterium]
MIDNPRQFLRQLFDVAVAAAQPSRVIASALPPLPRGRVIVLGGGKGAVAMAEAVEAAWPGRCSGVVVVRDGYARPTREIEVVEAGHPVPDERGVAAARRVLELAQAAGADDLVLCLISGGASAALALPRAGVSLAEKQAITKHLLACGATIHEINAVRKHLSMIKGGQLAAAAAPARVAALIVSDVIGDDIATIGSGPTVADPTTATEALSILDRHGAPVSETIRQGLASGAWETVKSLPARTTSRIIVRPRDALDAAKRWAETKGVVVVDLGDGFGREATVVAAQHLPKIVEAATGGRPTLILSGGEATVVIKGQGTGGPNTEFAVALALGLHQAGLHQSGLDHVWFLAADTDGTDGIGGHAGATIEPGFVAKCRGLGLDPVAALAANDTAGLLARTGHLLVTGPTFTNVNDFRAILVMRKE